MAGPLRGPQAWKWHLPHAKRSDPLKKLRDPKSPAPVLINIAKEDLKTLGPGAGAPAPAMPDPRRASGQTCKFLLLWSSTMLLFPSLGKLAFDGDAWPSLEMKMLTRWAWKRRACLHIMSRYQFPQGSFSVSTMGHCHQRSSVPVSRPSHLGVGEHPRASHLVGLRLNLKYLHFKQVPAISGITP